MLNSTNLFENRATIKVIGIGGAGTNAVNRMIEVGLIGVQFITMNTDVQALELAKSDRKVQLGPGVTKGLGAGGDPSIGAAAARESSQAIEEELEGTDMVFVTAGMGGGTGTGAAPVIAEIARRMGILTVGVVSKPFAFEGLRRRKQAEIGTAHLRSVVDTMITVPNDRLVTHVEKRTTLQQAFAQADDVLRQGVQGISDIILMPGVINVDFADVRAVMKDAGVAMMGIGRAQGPQRAKIAAQLAANCPLLEVPISGARKMLVNLSAGPDLSIGEAQDAMVYLQQFADRGDADIIFGHVLKEATGGYVQITILAAGLDESAQPTKPETLQAFTPKPIEVGRIVDARPKTSERHEPQAVSDPTPISIDEIVLDIPTFLSRQRTSD